MKDTYICSYARTPVGAFQGSLSTVPATKLGSNVIKSVVDKASINKKFIDLWWQNDGFKMPMDISFQSFDGQRDRKLMLNNSPTRIAIPLKSDLIIDPDNWVLYNLKQKSK